MSDKKAALHIAGNSQTPGCSSTMKRKLQKDPIDTALRKKQNVLPNENETYKQSGVKSSLHGIAYQWKLLMLFAIRAHRNGYSFRMATEMDEAEKFDDIVFHYIKSDEQFVKSKYLQAKHTEVESESNTKIETKDLMTEKDGRFSLQKYFHSFQKISSSNATNCENTDFIICTNIGFDFDQSYNDPTMKRLKASKKEKHIYFETVKNEDDILKYDGEFYRIVSDGKDPILRSEIVAYLREPLQRTSDMNRLAANLTEYICKGKRIDRKDELMKQYNMFLVSNVIDTKSNSISKTFWDQKKVKNDSVIKFRNVLLDVVRAYLYNLAKTEKNRQNKFTSNEKVLIEKLDLSKMLQDKQSSTNENIQIEKNLCKIQLNISDEFKKVFLPQHNPKLHNPIQIADFIAEKIKSNTDLFYEKQEMEELQKLAGHIFVLKNQRIGFSLKFLNGIQLPGNLEQFRKRLAAILGFKDIKDMGNSLSNTLFKRNKYMTCSEDDVITRYPEEYTDIDKQINSFLDHLLFVVNQPNEQKLTHLISGELEAESTEFNLIDSRFITRDFEVSMINWLKEKQGSYLSENKIYLNFLDLKQRLLETLFNGFTTLYQNKRLALNLKFQNVQIGIKEFLQEDASKCSKDKLIFPLKINPNSIKIGSSFIFQEIEKIEYFKKRGSFIFLKLNAFRRHEREILESLKNSCWKLLILECKDNSLDIDLQNVNFFERFESILNIENEERKKIIVISSIFELEMNPQELNLGFHNLTNESQQFVLERNVIFQRPEEIPLKNLVFHDQQVKMFIPIFEIATNPSYHIDKIMLPTEGYIERTLTKQTLVSQQINIDNDVRNGKNIIAETENDFNQLLQENCNRNIHLLTKIESKNILSWQKTHGSISLVRKYLSTDIEHIDVSKQLHSEFVDNLEKRKAIIIADTAGMGKTTILTDISFKLKKELPNLWISRVDLNLFTSELSSITTEYTNDMYLEFFCDQILKLRNVFEKMLFKSMLQHGNVILLFDGFDEISPLFEEETLALLHRIQETNIRQLWITTRPNLKELLEENFQQLSYIFQPFTLEEQNTFIEKFWTKKFDVRSKPHIELLQNNAKGLLDKWRESINEKDIEFAGIPLQTRMLAEAFELEIKTLIDNKVTSGSIFEFPEKLELLSLYEKFVDRKYLIYVSIKSNSLVVNIATRDIIAILKDGVNLRKIHQRLSIKTLFRNEQDIVSLADKDLEITEEKLTRIGIVHVNKTMHYFTHQTFAEYFIADFIACKLLKNMPDCFYVFLIEIVLMKVEYQVIRIFLDRFLLRYHNKEKNMTNEVFKKICLVIANGWKRGNLNTSEHTLLHLNIRENNDNILEFLNCCCSVSNISENVEIRSVFKEMLYARSQHDGNVWELSLRKGNVKILENFWTWSKGVLPRAELIDYMKDYKNRIVWNSVYFEHHAVIKALCTWVREVDLGSDAVFELILIEDDNAEYYENNTPWHYAVKRKSLEVVEALWDLCPEEKKKQLLVSTLKQKQRNIRFFHKLNAFQLACQCGRTEILMKLWSWIAQLFPEHLEKEQFLCKPVKFKMDFYPGWEMGVSFNYNLNQEQKKHMLTEHRTKTSDFGNCAIHLAVTESCFEAFKFVSECYEELGKDFKYILSLPNNHGQRILHLLSGFKMDKFLQSFAEFLVQKIDQYLLLELLQLRNREGKTARELGEGNENFIAWLRDLCKQFGLNFNEIT